MKLGELSDYLRDIPDKKVPVGIGEPDSYRGYYDELAFEVVKNTSIAEIRKAVVSAIGKVFTGYKGGEFRMEKYTPVWVASYGKLGVPLSKEWLDITLRPHVTQGTLDTARDCLLSNSFKVEDVERLLFIDLTTEVVTEQDIAETNPAFPKDDMS